MLLQELVKGLDFILKAGRLDKEICGVAYDSREVVKDGIFVAISGYAADGHAFIGQALEKGVNTVVVEKDVNLADDRLTVLKVEDSRLALAILSANYFGNPSAQMNLIGITGTNGKTSISYLLKGIFEQANRSIGLIGTIGTVIGSEFKKNKNTTPESYNLQQLLSEMVSNGIDNCVLEVSSHALSLNRVASCVFRAGIFTNLTPDHLELHNNMEEYFQAKAKLFRMSRDFNIINIDDKYGRRLADPAKGFQAKTVTYGLTDRADVYATDICYNADSTVFMAHTPQGGIEIKVNFPGEIYVSNSLAAIACACCYGISLQDIRQGIASVREIKGRFEVVYQDKDIRVIIDFAHTEDGLEKALTTIRPFTKGRLIIVFGVYAAPGLKGRDKRQAMGRVAALYSDFAVITSDNPKEQPPELIIEEIVDSFKKYSNNYAAIVDREEAIKYAIEISKPDDVILIAGKGHETTQKIGKTEVPLNEAAIVKEAIQKRKLKDKLA